MTNTADLTVADRIVQLPEHLGIEEAHFAARGLDDLILTLNMVAATYDSILKKREPFLRAQA